MKKRRKATSPDRRRRELPADRASPVPESTRTRETWIVASLLATVLVAFLPALRGGFAWDDVGYVRTNDTIRSLDVGSVLGMFGSVQHGNYHPLTMLSLAANFAISGLDPFGYHLLNLLLHGTNTFLVYRLVRSLSKHSGAAAVAAAFWGLHPLRVESVAWISGRKDLLYTGFFLLALLAYRRHVERPAAGTYLASLGSYLLSLLSKGMAVSLTLVLPLSDFLDRRRLTKRSVLDKVPFLALSVLFGLVAVWAQRSFGGIEEAPRPLSDRAAVASYGIVAYLVKTIWPLDLSALYPYPSGPLPTSYSLAFLAVLGVAAVVAWSLRHTRKVAFGFLFYLANIVFVLQVVPVGAAVIADRYTYLSSVGLAYLVGEGFVRLGSTSERSARSAIGAALLILATFGALTWQRCGAWHDNDTLWSDVISKYPASPIAYNNRGNARADSGDRAGAARDYEEAIRLKPDFVQARYNQAYLAGEMGDFATAADGLTRVLELAPDMVPARLHRADALLELRRAQEAIRDYDRVLELAPDLAPAYAGRARAWLDLGERSRATEDARRAEGLGFRLDTGFRAELESVPTSPPADRR